MMKKTIDYLHSILHKDDKIVIGCSGGPDSMCLLSLLVDIKELLNLKIIVCHVNHKVRKESDEEALFVEEYCKKNNLIYKYLELDIINKNFEAEAHNRRYDFYKKCVYEYNAKYLMTAHHGDDLIETVLFKIIRGSNLNGYMGFNLEQDYKDYKVVKPLIFVNKQTILDYCKKNNIEYRIDNTNFELNHIRNRIRHNILPYLKEENVNVHIKFYDYSNEINEVNRFINSTAIKEFSKFYVKDKFKLSEYLKLDDVIKKRGLELVFKTIYRNDLYLITNNNIKEIMKLLENKSSNGKVILPNGYVLIKSYGYFYVDKLRVVNNMIKKLEDINLYNGQLIEKINQSDDKSNFTIRLNSKELSLPLYIRTRNAGDKMEVKNLSGHKKIKDILIDEKINKEFRNELILLVDNNNNVIWIPGIKKSKFDKDFNQKYDIILRYKKEGDIYE